MSMPAPLPDNELQRLARLRALAVLDTAPEPLFDAITRLACDICETPIALVSLIDTHRQWFKSAQGLPGVSETPRDQAFCAHAIHQRGLMEVPDAALDPRFARNPLVTGEPGIRFYAGQVIKLADGTALGTLCVIDRRPRQLDAQQRLRLEQLSEVVSAALDMRGRTIEQALQAKNDFAAELREREKHYRLIVEDQTEFISLAAPDGTLRFVNQAYARFFGFDSTDAAVGRSLYEAVPEAERAPLGDHLANLLSSDATLHGENQVVDAQGRQRWVAWTNRGLRNEQGEVIGIHSVGRDITEWHETAAALMDQRQRLDLATQSNGIGIWEYQIDTGKLLWSDEMFKLADCPRDAFGGRLDDWQPWVHPEDLPSVQAALMAAIAGQRAMDIDMRVRHRDDSLHEINARATVVKRDENGCAIRVLGTAHEITERKRMERELAEKHELLRVTLMSIGDAVITTDAMGRVRWLNPVAERMTGWRTSAALSRPLSDIFQVHDEQSKTPLRCPVQACLSEGDVVPHQAHACLTSRDGTCYGIEESAAPIRDDQGQVLGAILVFRDVTAQRQLGQEMSYRARHDPLTGLINRSEFERQAQALLQRAQADDSHHALMYIDLDQFKLVNDACGHAVGDQLLRQVAQLFKGCVRAHDGLARLGGDEFGVLLEKCTVEQAYRAAQSICDAMEDFRFAHEGRRFRIGASIGLAPLDARWHDLAQAQQAADTACYAAKEAGRNRVHAWYDTDEALRARQGEIQWATRLEQALDEHHFELHAQRIRPVRGEPGQGLHAEVLLRLRDADGGMVAPGAFLPAAERFHLASRLDRWVMREVVRLLKEHDMAHVDTLAVNLSGQSIGDPAFQAFLKVLFAEAGIDVRKICLEVTETAVITRLDEARAFIEQLRALGVRIALDDFGAGASSFGYLKQLPVDYLKIDGQFIRRLTTDALDQAAVRCFKDVAGVLGLQTVAECVEDEVTLAALRQLGVDFAQGYLHHRPEPIEAALGLLNAMPA
jgi:diguanylate cyclase